MNHPPLKATAQNVERLAVAYCHRIKQQDFRGIMLLFVTQVFQHVQGDEIDYEWLGKFADALCTCCETSTPIFSPRMRENVLAYLVDAEVQVRDPENHEMMDLVIWIAKNPSP